eukprot:1838367-Rhodomonas_salina.1
MDGRIEEFKVHSAQCSVLSAQGQRQQLSCAPPLPPYIPKSKTRNCIPGTQIVFISAPCHADHTLPHYCGRGYLAD